MSEQKFTSAPWSQSLTICDEEGNYSTQVFSTETGETIATLAWAKMPPQKVVIDGKPKIQTGTYREGNAKLIAAAHELLEACERALQVLEQENIFGQARLLLVVAIKKALS